MTIYTVTEVDGRWYAWADGKTRLGHRPGKIPAKRLCEQQAGRRQLTWTWDAKTRTYTSDEA